MFETYEKLSIDIEIINQEDVITTSSPVKDDVHDNAFSGWLSFE